MIHLVPGYCPILVPRSQQAIARKLTSSPIPIQRDRKSSIQSFALGSSNAEYRFHLGRPIIVPLFYTLKRICPAINVWVAIVVGNRLTWCARVRHFWSTTEKNVQRPRDEIYCIVGICIEIGFGRRYKCLCSFVVAHINRTPIVDRYDCLLLGYETTANIWLKSGNRTENIVMIYGNFIPIRAKHQKRACSSFPEKPLIPAAWIRYAQPSKWRRHSLGLPIVHQFWAAR